MVYIGKPSRACLPCRKRKLRCDLKKSTCGQCSRAGLACSGYRDPNALRIRDESQSTKQKALVSKTESVPRFGELSLQQKARNVFFAHYVYGLAKTYDVIERLNKKTTLERHLDASIDAASLAFFHFQFYSTKASFLARETYLSALQLVNEALTHPRGLASDSTLLAVLLLDLFEKTTNNNPRSSESWMSHVNGALALVKLRDTVQFQTYIGLRLSVRLSTNMLISCVAANSPVPLGLLKLRSDLQAYVNVEDPKWKVSGLTIKYANLRGAVQEGLLSATETISQAKKLDNEFSWLSANMPTTWLSQRKYLQSPSERVFGQFYDLYPDYFTTQTRNVIRITRILLNDMIRTTYKQEYLECNTPPSETIHVDFTDRIIDDLAREICASGPQFTGVDDMPKNREERPAEQILYCYTLLFPFYVAALYASPSSIVKPWVTNQLRFICTDLSIRNAGIVADILDKDVGMDPWSVYAILGSYAFAA